MTKFYMVKGDLKPAIQAQLKWKDDSIPDLTSCTVKFHMKQGDSTLIDAAASIVSPPADGKVQYDWSGSDTDVSGVCKAEFEVTWSDGKTTTWPTEGDLEIIFRESYD